MHLFLSSPLPISIYFYTLQCITTCPLRTYIFFNNGPVVSLHLSVSLSWTGTCFYCFVRIPVLMTAIKANSDSNAKLGSVLSPKIKH